MIVTASKHFFSHCHNRNARIAECTMAVGLEGDRLQFESLFHICYSVIFPDEANGAPCRLLLRLTELILMVLQALCLMKCSICQSMGTVIFHNEESDSWPLWLKVRIRADISSSSASIYLPSFWSSSLFVSWCIYSTKYVHFNFHSVTKWNFTGLGLAF